MQAREGSTIFLEPLRLSAASQAMMGYDGQMESLAGLKPKLNPSYLMNYLIDRKEEAANVHIVHPFCRTAWKTHDSQLVSIHGQPRGIVWQTRGVEAALTTECHIGNHRATA